jgi:uncharacterized OsmC-like protein
MSVAENFIVNKVLSTSTHVFGRTLNSAGPHHFVIDGSSEPKEEILSTDAFLAGVSSCAVHLIEHFARETNIPLSRVAAEITGLRPVDEPQRFDHLDFRVVLTGPTRDQANELFRRYQNR